MADGARVAARQGAAAARLGLSVVLLALVLALVEPGPVLARLLSLEPGWVVLAILVSAVQVVLSAWRWRFTAARLGIELPPGEALREYYLATFLNQVLPGGVVGDLSRAWRHGRARSGSPVPEGRAMRVVLLERASGQMVMSAAAAVSILWLPLPRPTDRLLAGVAVLAAGAGGVALLLWLRRPAGRRPSMTDRIREEARVALLAPRALPVQLGSSALVVASYVVVYLAGARAVGIDAPLVILAPLVPPVLVAMLIPVTVAGWGIREGAAAVVWGAAGLAAADGVAASVTYGALVLVSSLPGALILLLPRRPRP